MSEKEHKSGVSEVSLVVRHLKLENPDSEHILAAMAEIKQMYGMDSVNFDETAQVLNLAYDASRVSIDGIEALLHRHGLEVSHDWWTRFKEGYYRFVDQNVKENKNHKPAKYKK